MNRRKLRLGYLVSHPIQYQVPMFRHLAQSEAIEFVAIFGCDFGLRIKHDKGFGREVDFGIDLMSGYESVFLSRPTHPCVDRFVALRLPLMRGMTVLERLDVIVLHGWRTLMMWQAAWQARRRCQPYLVRAEAPWLGTQQRRPWPKQFLWRHLVGRFVGGSAGTLALGGANRRFYQNLGVPQEQIFPMPYFVDNEAVALAACEGRQQRDRLRIDLGVPVDALVVIAVGKLQQRKRPLDLVRCLPHLPGNIHLLWIGSGEMEPVVKAEARLLGVSKRVHLAGFRPSSEAWRLLGAADIFAHPAEREPWGLVVNEALAAGLPLLVSSDTGAAEDLVSSEIGQVLPVGRLDLWTAAIRNQADTLHQFNSSSAARQRLLRDYSVPTASECIISAAFSVTREKKF